MGLREGGEAVNTKLLTQKLHAEVSKKGSSVTGTPSFQILDAQTVGKCMVEHRKRKYVGPR